MTLVFSDLEADSFLTRARSSDCHLVRYLPLSKSLRETRIANDGGRKSAASAGFANFGECMESPNLRALQPRWSLALMFA